MVELLERTGFPEVLGREWIFVRMHDAVVRCLATMVACGHPIKPTAAIDSAAVSPRAAQVRRSALYTVCKVVSLAHPHIPILACLVVAAIFCVAISACLAAIALLARRC